MQDWYQGSICPLFFTQPLVLVSLGESCLSVEWMQGFGITAIQACPGIFQLWNGTQMLHGCLAEKDIEQYVTPPEQMIEQEELRVQMASKEQLIHQLNVHLREANHSQEKSKAEVLEKEVKIQELQEIITDLHHEISLKDSETVNQLQEKHLLETTVQSLRQLLDAQEQRIYQVQTKQTARQAELEQKCSWIQQLEQDLEASRRLQEESQRQLGECHVPLAQVAGENEALQSQQLLETETLMSSLRTWEKASGSLSCEMPEHQWEEQAELQQRLADVQDELQKKEAATHRLQAELQDAGLLAAERSEALQSLQEARQVLKLRTAEQEGTIRTLEGHRTKDLEKLQDAEEQLLQREEQKADLVAAQEERSRCRAQLSELRADQPRQAVELAVLGEKQQTTQQELCSREQPSAELSGYLKTAEEALTRAKDEGTESVAEVGGLKGKLHQLQDDIRSLQEICGERAKAMAEQTCCMQQLQHEREIGITQGQNQATLVEQLQGELKSCKQAHQTDLEQLRAKLQHLQQELDVCKEKNQANLSRLQQRECTTERQSLALECLLQQCQALKDEGLYYEEVVQKQERELCQQQAQLREAQEHLAVAESSLDLYKKKYQASLTRAGELEGKVQRLEEDLQDVSSQQEATGRCSQRAVEQLTQALHATEEELCRSRQHAHHCEQTIQGLREQLAASQTQRMAAEERLVTVQAELASYTATHSHSNASYQSQAARAETLQQTLSQAEGESARHSQRAEDYQRLVQDLKLELLSVTEQKNGARKELGVLELQVQSLRQEVAAAGERQRLEVSRMQQLEDELRASRRLCAQKEQITQSQDEQLWQAHSALQERGLEVERQRAEARSLDVRLQQERAQSQAASSALREEMQLLRQSLQDSQRQQQEAARALAQQEEKLLLAQSSLQSTQGQLRQRRAEVVGLEQASHRLEAELRALQARVSSSEDEAEQSRTQLGQLRSELSQGQQAAAQLELKLRRSQEQARALQQQLQEQDASQQELREELSRRQGREDELQRQVQGAQERAGLLESERQELQRQLREQARRALQGGRSQLEEEGQRLREQLRQCSAQLESTSSSLGQAQQRLQQQAGEVTCQETALARLQEELEAAQARERQSSRRLSAAEATLQELTLTAASCHESQSQALEQLREKAQEAGALQAELVRAQQREAQLQAEKGAHEERLKRLNGELRKLQGFQQQSEQEARCCAEQLGQRNSQAQQWQRRHRASSRALAQREEELLVCKVELASLKEKLHGAVEERQRLQQDLNGLRQKFVATSSEVEALRSSLGAARSDSHRLQHESELVLANVSQWVQEQKQANEKLGHKIRAQVKHIAQLTGEKDHLQEVLVHLQQENRRLKGEVDERRIECERLKARWSSSSDVGAGLGQPWALLLGEE